MTTKTNRWTAERAAEWMKKLGWVTGTNYYPRTACNQLEMWQPDTFDPQTIEQEMRWSADLGFNCHRVYLHDLLWEDAGGFKKRLDQVLAIFAKTGHTMMPTLLDDCWRWEPKLGPQPEPIPGVHNSQWLQSPAKSVKQRWDENDRSRMKAYVQGVVEYLKHHPAIVMWDLYNEPGNQFQDPDEPEAQRGFNSLPILEDVFAWAREVNPDQPLTAGVHNVGESYAEVTAWQAKHSDVLTFHHYQTVDTLPDALEHFFKDEDSSRPKICTEYLARGVGCTFESHMTEFKRLNIGAINWGFVDGRTQTKFPWNSKEGGPEPEPWHHEVLHADGTPYREKEAALIRELTGGPRKVD